MAKIRIRKESGGVAIPRKVLRGGTRLLRAAKPLAATTMLSAMIAGILTGLRVTSRQSFRA